MCLQQPTNLLHLGRYPINRKTKRLLDHHQRVSPREQQFVERLTKKAIYTHCSPELANEAINGYRRSATNPEAGEEGFLKTDLPYHDVPRDFHYKRALKVVEKMFRPSRRLKPISFPDLRYYPWTLPTAAEAPFTESKYWQEIVRQKAREGEIDTDRMSFHNLYNEIFHINRRLVHEIKYGRKPFWTDNGEPLSYEFTYLHSRSHMVKQDKPDKIRAVFGVPKLLLMVENMFIWNIQREYLNAPLGKSPLLWGFETIRGGWMKLIDKLSSKHVTHILSADWSGFDHKALHEVIDDVHDIWRSWFDFDQGYEPSKSNTHDYSDTKSREEQIDRLWTWMCNAIKHTPIKAESGNMYQWQWNGIASGFQQTQLLDSFVNAIYLLTCLSACGINIDSEHFQALFQGDDSVTTFPEMISNPNAFTEKLSNEAKRRFNADLSIEKTTFGTTTDDVDVLSYSNRSGIAYRSSAELLAHLLYPERPRRPAECAAAAAGIAQAAMGSSREVYNTCKDVYHFLVETLEIEPEWKAVSPNKPTPYSMDVQEFPSYLTTFLQNFDHRMRTDQDKQRLWPTIPTGNGFHFLNS
uniref:RNA-dependent RNA polymerase n=1 Tax=Hypomyces chrysospermus partitivirus 1 TaxID=2598877 RepID=A0A518N0G0_9VIRU|nr:RNA-dependent RNA polymerase [Hypomyces chrysospermus partitivirus 1]